MLCRGCFTFCTLLCSLDSMIKQRKWDGIEEDSTVQYSTEDMVINRTFQNG